MNGSTSLPSQGKRGKQIGAVDRLLTRTITGFHRAILRWSGGRAMNKMGGNPVLILTTTGSKTGRPRSHPVIAVLDGADRLVVATNGGAAKHPSWLRNVAANPEVRLNLGGEEVPMRAAILSSERKKEVWPKLVAAYRSYDAMQRKTDRDIPVVRLSPTPDRG
jgi:F420H(2)-dependent quinone reductase